MKKDQENPKYRSYIRLLATNQRRIYGFIYAMVPNYAASDDIMQETTLFMWEHYDNFKKGTNFAAWGISIARNMVMRYCRKQKRKGLTFGIESMTHLIDQSDVFDSKDDHIEALHHCYKKLKNNEQQLLEMRYIQGNSVREIAERINRTTSHLYRIMSKIHLLLLKCINAEMIS